MGLIYTSAIVNTPQSEPQLGRNQVQNNAGGYTYQLDGWGQLERFLILGAEGGTYYVGERKLVRENAAVVERLLKTDGLRVVRTLEQVSTSGRAHKNGPALFALALAMKLGDEDTRRAAGAVVPAVARTGTHLFELVEYLNALGGWGRGTKRAVANWYRGKSADDLGYQLVKYQSRNGWSHRDVLRLVHAKPTDAAQDRSFAWAVGRDESDWPAVPEVIAAFEEAKKANSAKEIAALIRKANLPREAVPTQWLTEREVWEALAENMPITALLRNLATMTRAGLFEDRGTTDLAIGKLTDVNVLSRGRVHPMSVLLALHTYSRGAGDRGTNTWTPNQRIVGALDDAFYKSFQAVRPTGKRWSVNLDISGSMSTAFVAGSSSLNAAQASMAMAMVTLATERDTVTQVFNRGVERVTNISAGRRLDENLRANHWEGGATDCAAPIMDALNRREPFDVFAVYTDNETWAGRIHPDAALREYRKVVNPDAKLVVVGMAATGFTIADPNDAGMLDVVGFDASAPAVMADFARA